MTTHDTLYWTQGLHRALQQRPDDVATVFEGRERTFLEHVDRVSRLAGALRDLGVGTGDRVGILALNSDRYHELLLATCWADGVFNVVDSMRSPVEIGTMLAATDTRVLFVDDAFAPAVDVIRRAWPNLETLVHMGDGPTPGGAPDYESLVGGSDPVPDARRSGDAVAGLVHTGGTTGAPKTVMVGHRQFATAVLGLGGAVPGLVTPGGRMLQVTPMSHVSGLAMALLTSMFGRTFVPVRQFEPEAVLDAVERYRITTTALVPSMLQAVVDHPSAQRRDLSGVGLIGYGAAPITPAALARARERFPRADFAQLYGMSESISMTILTPEDHRRSRGLSSAGRAAALSEVRVVDAEGRDLPPDTPGEILLGGAGQMLGYWDDPEATAAVMRDGWMHTGDVGRLDTEGFLYVEDRLKDVIIVSGDNVHSTEVEGALGSHPDVATCAVIAVPDEETGERVHAVVVPVAGAAPEPEQLRKHCSTLLADHQVPRSWDLVTALPTSPTGKVLKRELRAPYWEGRERRVH